MGIFFQSNELDSSALMARLAVLITAFKWVLSNVTSIPSIVVFLLGAGNIFQVNRVYIQFVTITGGRISRECFPVGQERFWRQSPV